jgi:hypothetical protein
MADLKQLASKNTALPTSGPTATVPKDPQPSVDRIDDLARRILRGDILLPKFQRSFVWERSQILMLLDSVAKGFPIGSVLLWQSRQELRSENRIADLNIDLPRPDYPVNYLLDGQQRLSAICGAMFWNGGDPNSRWNIAYDLRAAKFLHLDTLEDPPLHQIRINKLADPAAFFRHIATLDTLSAPDKAQLKEKAECLFNRFKDYKIATVTLGDMSIQDVAPIFERINSTGTSLTIVDLMRAATWSPDFDLIDCIQEILNDLDEKKFGNIDKKSVLRNISAAAGGGFSVESIDLLRNHTPANLKGAVNEVKEAFRKAVDYLSTQIGVANADAVPYSNQLTVLAELFRILPTPTAAQYNSISQWFWKSAASGYFSGWNTGMMATDLEAIKSFAAGEDHIQFDAAWPSADIWRTRQFRANNALAKLLGMLLAHRQPIDLITGQRVDTTNALAWSNTKEFHHFFPQAFLKAKGERAGKINALANIVILSSVSNKLISDKKPSEYLKAVRVHAGPQLKAWLDSNLIPQEAFEAALRDDYDQFLALRSAAIHKVLLQKAGV